MDKLEGIGFGLSVVMDVVCVYYGMIEWKYEEGVICFEVYFFRVGEEIDGEDFDC